MNTNTLNFQSMNKHTLMKLLAFAQYGIAGELKQLQANILAQKQFGAVAVTGISYYNPLRPLKDDVKEHDELVEFSKQVQHLLDHVKDLHTDEAVREFIAKTKR